jgi:hypothetical protein
MVKVNALLIVVLLAYLFSGCAGGPIANSAHRMGELTTVGPVNYTVLETEWRPQLGDGVEVLIPSNRFLLVRLTISNSGNQQIAIPLLHLVDSDEQEHLEVAKVRGVPNWLGILRVLEPASTIQGSLVFDVPAGDYYLRITDGGDLEDERTALIEIPMTLDAPGAIESTPAPIPGLQ